MNQSLIVALTFVLFAGIANAAESPGTEIRGITAATTALPSNPVSGVDTRYIDQSARAQDDFFKYVNGKWLDSTPIPGDKSNWGTFAKLRDDTQPQLREIIEAAAHDADKSAGSEAQKIGDFYASFTDEDRLEKLGIKPLQNEIARVNALKAKKEIPALIAHFNRIGVTAPYHFDVHQDARDSTRYVVDFAQSGLGLPDRDYYLKIEDVKLNAVRLKYQIHIEAILTLAGDPNPAANARQIVALETELAKVQWTKVENRDPVKTYNKVDIAKLDVLAPGYDWKSYLAAAGVAGKVSYVIVSQPSYITGFGKTLQQTSLSTWKAYFRWHLLHSYASKLSKAFVDEDFSFRGTVLRGVPKNEPRWKRGVVAVERALGEAIGKLYVAQHFAPEKKARMEGLVKNLLTAYRQSIDTLDWMSAQTKTEARAKLAKFTPKIGYPNKWRDYRGFLVRKDDLVGNTMRASVFEYQYALDKLGKPIDRDEWGMTPQTVNAYYNPELNEIVFPAAILQPPFFNADADDAVNYGAIGAVIGHEISHGFDDHGSQYDGDGNLRDWWTKDDHRNFAAKTRMLVEQYGSFSPLPGYKLNGALTLGENIADNSGLAIAYKAYHLSLGGKAAPEIDGLSGDQRLYMGYAQVWRAKLRDQETMVRIKSDPHSPPQFRVNGTLPNQPGFFAAFGVKEGDKMYLAPEKRVIIW